ncbi:hypothetical protein EJ03DRAFT_374736 [Teratosphaeria nubilosa]|uniref:Uncharacterized protein n=1 Tax=Teratosphaeria nubilosa TaxID=161662 RepID=A0A6G1L8G1_9PEZI|nr:hypothetical protein EJ03DRAFT_374736 [Teratosphaeria nubilosa]
MSARGRTSSWPRHQLPEDRVAASRQERGSWPLDQHAARHSTTHGLTHTPPSRSRGCSPRPRSGTSFLPVVIIGTICWICISLCMLYPVPPQHPVTPDVLRKELSAMAPWLLQGDVTRLLAPLPSRLGEAFTETWFRDLRQDGGEAESD